MRKIVLLGEINVNCYFIENEGKCYIVDPGHEKDKLREFVKENNLQVVGILLTHAHIDHIGAIDAFNVPVYLHKNEYEVMLDDYKNGFELYGRKKPYDLEMINLIEIDESTRIPLGEQCIEVIYTPGHTIGSVCYQLDNNLYTGDTLFKGTVGKWDFPTGNINQLKRSIVQLIDTQSDEVNIYPAHGKSSTIGEERSNNQFYKDWK